LAKSSETVFTGDLSGGDPERNDAEKYGRSVDTVYQPVRLPELSEARESPATTRNWSLREEEDGKEGCSKGQTDITS
jgi:hypothetical protein